MNEKYILCDRQTNNWIIGEFSSRKSAKKELEENEKEDKKNGAYEVDFYEIILKNNK